MNAADTLRSLDAMNPENRSYLRFVELENAEFICELRTDPTLSQHLTATTADVEMQRRWIVQYKEREKSGLEFYFIVVCDSRNCGVVRMYDFRTVKDVSSFCWGSWIIASPRPKGLVTFSAIMIYEIGFDALGFRRSHFDVRKANVGVVAFHERAGARREGEDAENLYFGYWPDDYARFRAASAEQIALHRRPRA